MAKIQLTEKQTDVFYLQATLGNSETSEFLFDTGSGYLAINESLLGKLQKSGEKNATYQRTIHARLANGAVHAVKIYTVASLNLGSDCELRNVEAAILPGNSRNIIGMNVLKMVDSFSVSFKPSVLTLTGCDKPEQTVAAL